MHSDVPTPLAYLDYLPEGGDAITAVPVDQFIATHEASRSLGASRR